MSDQACDCCGSTTVRTTERTASHDRWLVGRPVTEVPLPQAVGKSMGQFLGDEPVDTLAGFVVAIRDATGGGSLAVDDLCHAATETPHRATMDDEGYFFQCFYDGVALAHLADESVEIRTESPAGEPVEMRASPDGTVDVTPSGAAMSFGVAADGDAPRSADPTPEEAYGAICPYVKAFPSREAYGRWAESIDVVTVGLPLAAGVPIAAALAE
jgi:hypothetical protein